MARFFSEDSQKKIAESVKWFEQNAVGETGGADSPINPGRPPRFYKTPDVNNDNIPSSATLFPLDCKLMQITSPSEGNFEFSETTVTEEVLFDYIPESDVVIQATNFNGRPCAFSQQLKIMPVELVKSSGDAGDLDTKCSFKYDIYSYGGGELLDSDVNPLPNDGLFERTDIGAYKEASYGLAWPYNQADGSGLGYAIAWCNEVPEVAECEASDNIQLMWAGVYDDSKTYPANNAVTDGAYMMVSNKTTDTKAAPQPLKEPEFKIGTVPTWAQVSGAGYETITGQRYTWSKGGQLLKVRVYIPTPSGGGGGGGVGP